MFKGCALLGYYAASSGNFYHRFGTTYRSNPQASEGRTDRLSWNFGKELLLMAV